ncbi:non-homologous end joining protein Ku [Dielma fastidiosa]|uniref:Non-homologous end joining protein Ku n=1 Tax=Dielma fastidiosa TaxID=1034346 RepID=A0AB35UJQ2_9FIRM|nr:Ku protein [Dielma fastidiosa]MDY5168120.1 Ku protein [Dielma fastidiosa]
MAAAHKGAISFGLVHIPIQMYRTTQDHDISFNQLCKDTHERVRYKKYCPNCEKELKSADIVKGYQYEKDKYVIMTDDEIDELKVEKDRTINILHFTNLENVDDIYYEKNYYAIPEKHAEKAYELLYEAMRKQGVVAIAKTVIGTKETLLALCPQSDGLLVKTLFYQEEIAPLPKDILHPKISKAELNMAEKLIQSMTAPYEPQQYHDEFQEKLRAAIEAKINGSLIVQASNAKADNETPIDLMEALQQSIASMAPKRKVAAKRRSAHH